MNAWVAVGSVNVSVAVSVVVRSVNGSVVEGSVNVSVVVSVAVGSVNVAVAVGSVNVTVQYLPTNTGGSIHKFMSSTLRAAGSRTDHIFQP